MVKMFKYVLLAFLPILIACSKEEPAQDIIIDFSGNNNVLNEIVKAGARSYMVITNADLQGKSFGVYGLRSGTNSSYTIPVFETHSAKQVSYGGGAWGYTPKAKWVRSNYYRFRAFWPYENIVEDDLINSGSDANLLSLSYSSGVHNYDLQVAYEERYPVTHGVGTVELAFKHALSAIKFNVKFHESEEGDDNITTFYMTGLTIVGTLMYGEDGTNATPADFRWISIYKDSDTKLFQWEGSKQFNKTDAATVFDDDDDSDKDGVVFAIPQEIAGGAATINFTTTKGGSALHSASLPATTWEAGKLYTYNIIIKGASISLNVDIADWTGVDSNIDINL
ncbi:MAG: fimbrillin family protein [Bacteroidales bacterium]|nr:fimbrillin family protein [Bacteroidales bacterium]